MKKVSNNPILLAAAVILVAIFLRFFQLTKVPPALYQDETAIGYNAYSILQTGKDEYGITFPLYFRSFGDYKLPVYIYTTVISEKIFGLTEFAVRFPSAFSGVLSVIGIMLLANLLTKNKTISLISGLLLSINPWSLQFSRAAFEVNMAVMFLTFATYLFVRSVYHRKKILFLFSLVLFALSLYSYNVSRLFIPVFVLFLFFWFRKQSILGEKKFIIIVLLFSIVLILPFLVTFFSPSGVASASSNLIVGIDSKMRTVEIRSYILSTPLIFQKILYGRISIIVYQFFLNLATIINGNFFFANGANNLNHGISNFGLFYLFEFPLLCIGIFSVIKNKKKKFAVLFVWLILAYGILALSKDLMATRAFFLVIPFEVFIAYGMSIVIASIQLLPKNKKIIISALISIFVLYSMQFYFISYYYRYPIYSAESWRMTDKELATFLKTVDSQYDSIIIDSSVDFMYTSHLFYAAYPPEEFILTAQRQMKGLFEVTKSYGKVEIRDVHWNDDMRKKKTLIITSGLTDISGKHVVATFSAPTKPVVLSVNNEIVQYPITQTDYIAISTE